MGKRWLFLAHRWMGIILCLFMALWFLSGVVMMYVGYPKLTQQERLQSSPPIAAASCCAGADTLLSALPQDARLKSLRLGMVASQPRFFAAVGNRNILGLDASSGMAVPATDAAGARAAAARFAPDAAIETAEKVDEDAWTHSKALDPHRPLFRVGLKHPELAMLYVSGVTGEVIRDVSVVEKYWNWIGAWLHWLYPFRGGIFDAIWTDIIIYSALIGTILSVVGMAIGVMRWRRSGYPNGRCSPYRNGMMHWHHVIGLFTGFFIFAWVASGLLSVNPWKIFDSGAEKPIERILDRTLLSAHFDPTAALRCFADNGIDVHELEWLRFDDQIHVIARTADNRSWILRNAGQCRVSASYSEAEILAEGLRLMPHAKPVDGALQFDHDWHYYARAPHTMTGSVDKPLPVMVIKFADPHQTWLYIDIRTARIVQRSDNHTRVRRWLFSFFHSWDWKVLLDHRPVWDVLLILGSLAGMFVSLSAVVFSWQRLSR